MTYDEFFHTALMFAAFLMGWGLSDLLKKYERHKSGGTVKPADRLQSADDLQRWLDSKTMEQAKIDRDAALRYDEAAAIISQQLVALGWTVSHRRPGRDWETTRGVGPQLRVSIDKSHDSITIENGVSSWLYKLSHDPSYQARFQYYCASAQAFSAQAFHDYAASAASQPQPITPI